VAARRKRSTSLDEAQADQLRRFAGQVGPLLDQLSEHVETQRLVEAGEGDALFRREAIVAAAPRAWGDLIRVSPRWVSWSYWVLVMLLVCGALFVCFVPLATYSSGPAVIRATARRSLTARASGNVIGVDVRPGDRVASGTVIARVDEIDGEHAIVSPISGTVSDLRVSPGQRIEAGDVAASITGERGGLELVALLPGEDRPRLATGMKIRLEVAGYRYAYQLLEIESVSSDVIGPSEARRVLGRDVAEGLPLSGSVVIVRARIANNAFVVDGRALDYHDGMRGTAEVLVHKEPILLALIPGLKRLL
jgi:hypothetical protein